MTKYVTQGEREMVTAVVADMDIQSGVEGLDIGSTCFSVTPSGRITYEVCAASSLSDPWGDAVFIYRSRQDGSSAAASWRFAGPLYVDGGPNGSDQGHRVASRDWVFGRLSDYATRDWVEDQLPPPQPAIETQEQWLVSSDRTLLGVTFSSVGNHEFEYQHDPEVQITFHPRVGSANAPTPWVTFQHRYMEDATFGYKLRVRCIGETGSTVPFVAQVRRVTHP